MRKRNDHNMYKRGDIWWGDIDGYGHRPLCILSNNALNNTSDYVSVCPVTSKHKRDLECHVQFKGVKNDELKTFTILVEQIQTIRKSQLDNMEFCLNEKEKRDLAMAITATFGVD